KERLVRARLSGLVVADQTVGSLLQCVVSEVGLPFDDGSACFHLGRGSHQSFVNCGLVGLREHAGRNRQNTEDDRYTFHGVISSSAARTILPHLAPARKTRRSLPARIRETVASAVGFSISWLGPGSDLSPRGFRRQPAAEARSMVIRLKDPG